MGRIPVESCDARHVRLDGRDVLAFAGCNYLGLSFHPDVQRAVRDGLTRFGLSTTASRETTGNTLTHEALETELAAFVGQEAAILTAEGYTANFAACQALARTCGVALLDSKSHRSLRNAATAAGMQVFEYEHLDATSAAWVIEKYADAGVAILTDSVFAADGAVAPLRDLLAALPRDRAALLVDDCHGFCVLGRAGRGAVDHFDLNDPRIVITTTLAKGLGCYGGAVMGRSTFIRTVREHAGVYRGSTPVPPAIAEGCRAAVRVLTTEPWRVDRLRENVARIRRGLLELGLRVPDAAAGEGAGAHVPIFTFVMEPRAEMDRISDSMRERGVLAPVIDYPGGPAPRYFRVVVNAMHEPADIERLLAELRRALDSSSPAPANAAPAAGVTALARGS
ncbi:MAG: aminotransferase class I/II-fold pyridoxal phosphate-dependent enzyme [Phycisphaerales bacterium]